MLGVLCVFFLFVCVFAVCVLCVCFVCALCVLCVCVFCVCFVFVLCVLCVCFVCAQTSDDCVRQMISFKIANEKKKIMMRREMIIHPSSFMGTELPNMD